MGTPKLYSGNKLGSVLCDALGIDKSKVSRIIIDCDVTQAATVTVHSFIRVFDEERKVQVTEELRQYRLEPIELEQTG